MKSPLKLAVIVATRNRFELLSSRSLPSIKKQSKKPDLLIVCDDSDVVFQRVNEELIQKTSISGCKVSYLKNSRTTGASGCWNSAAFFIASQVASAENIVLAFLDDDDSWHPNYLEQCMNSVQAFALDMVASGINRIETGSKVAFQNPAPDSLETSLFLSGNPGIQGSNLFLRLSTFLQAGGFDESLASSTDRDLCIRLAEMGSVRYQSLPQFLVNHYAESNRSRLSTRGSDAKLSGLSSFWNKYHTRMNTVETQSFKQRAHELFGWKAPLDEGVPAESQATNKAIILGVNTDLSPEFLNKLIAYFKHFRTIDLVGLDVVFRVEPGNSVHETFVEALRNLGVGCFPITQTEFLDLYTNQVSALRPGSTIWLVNRLADIHLDPFKDAESYLAHSGAKVVESSNFQKSSLLQSQLSTIKEDVFHQRVVSAEHRVNHHFQTKDLRLLGSGSEAIVFTDGATVYKCIDYWKTRTPKAQFEFLKNCGPSWVDSPGIYPLKQVIRDGAWVLIAYPYEKSSLYDGGHEQRIIDLINGCTRAGIVCNNIHPKNLILTEAEVKLIDYGSDIRPWNPLGFEQMARCAYLSCHHANRSDLKELMRRSLTDTSIPELCGFEVFRAKLDYPVHILKHAEFAIEAAPQHHPFKLVVGIISSDPVMLMPLLNSLRVLRAHPSLISLSVIVLCNGCDVAQFVELKTAAIGGWLEVRFIAEETQIEDAKSGYFGLEIQNRPAGQVGIALARTMLQRYLGNELTKSPGSIGWLLDDDMRIDERARDYIGWLPAFREQNVDVLFGAYEGSSPNPPLNGLRVQLMDLVHNAAWLAELPEDSVLPDRTKCNDAIRCKYPDYYYDLSRKHSDHLETTLWLEPSYPFETVKEARARLFAGALGILDGAPLTRSIIARRCQNPINEAKDSVNRGGCTFILDPEALLQTPNVIPTLNGNEARRSDMIWAIINKHYRRMTLKSVAFSVHHVGRSYSKPTLNPVKVQGEIVGSALYAGLTGFLSDKSEHQLNFSTDEIESIYQASMFHMESRLRLLEHSFYRISGLTQAIAKGPFYKELKVLSDCLEQEFSLKAFEEIKSEIRNLSKNEVIRFLERMTKSSDAYSSAASESRIPSICEQVAVVEIQSEITD